MKIKQKVIFTILMALSFLLVGCNNDGGKIKVGILQFANAPALDSAREGFISSLANEGLIEGENIIIKLENANTDFDIMMAQAKRLVRNNDLVLGIATPAAVALANEAKEQGIDIPILFTAVTDPIDAGLIKSNEFPGGNITGTNDLNPIKEQIALVTELLPEAKNLGILYTTSETNSLPQVEIATKHALEINLNVITKTITSINDLRQVASSLAREVDIIYIPTDNILAASIQTLGDILKELKTPLIVGEDTLVSFAPSLTLGINYFNLGYLTGEMAVSILKDNKKPSEIPSVGLSDFTLAINEDLLNEIGIEVPESLLERLGH